MNDLVKLEIFLPEEALAACREALIAAGAGRIGDYEGCAAATEVTGYWRPLAGANPWLGKVGEDCTAAEIRLDVLCPQMCLERALTAVRAVHPYETPLIFVIPLDGAAMRLVWEAQ